jgi:Spy/CpxP family protein refolding chaperone
MIGNHYGQHTKKSAHPADLALAQLLHTTSRRLHSSYGQGLHAVHYRNPSIRGVAIMQTFLKTISRPATVLILALPLAVACRGPGHGMAKMTEAQLAERMEDVAEWGLDSVDADDAQIERVNQVLRGFAPDVVQFRTEHAAIAAELRAELAKDSIDHQRVEAIRKRALALFDRASQKASEKLVAAAEVLTPAQRNELVYRWEKHRQ